MQNIHDEFTIYSIAKESMTQKFLAAVKNKEVPILERLDIWEKYADKILPTGKWISDSPKWLRKAHEDYLDRHQELSFTDLLEYLPEDSVIFNSNKDEIVDVTSAGVEMIEEVFNTGYCGTQCDW